MSDINVPSPPSGTVPYPTEPAPVAPTTTQPPLIPVEPRTTTSTTEVDPRIAQIAADRGSRTFDAPPPALQINNLNQQIARGDFGKTQTYLGVPRLTVPIGVSPEIQQFLDSKPTLTRHVWTEGDESGQGWKDRIVGALTDFSEPGSDSRSRFDKKLYGIVPDEMKYDEILDEMWMLPFISIVARADPATGVVINGVHFDNMDIYAAHQAYKDDSSSIFASIAEDIEVDMENTNPGGYNQNDVALATDQILANMLNSTSIEIQTRPDLDAETSKIEQRLQEPEPVRIELEDGVPVRTGGPGPMPYEAVVDDEGGVGMINPVPLLNSRQFRELVQSSEADWDRIMFLDQETFDDGNQTADVQVGLGQYGGQATREGSQAPARARQYSPAAAVRAIYDLSSQELGNLQDRLVRSGYLQANEQGFVDRGNPSDRATTAAWKSALTDALKNNKGVDAQIKQRVISTPLMSQVDTYAADWIRGNLGRNITFGEKQMMRRYVNDPNRQATTDQDLSLGSQIEKFVSAQTKTERETIASNNAGNNARAFALDDRGY
jgi:hypothetical protein